MDDTTFVRRRRWSPQEKRIVVTEALTSGNVIATAKRHGIQAQQIYRWRDRLEVRPTPATFLAVAVATDPALPGPTPVPAGMPAAVPDDTNRDPASRPECRSRIEIVLSAGRRIIVDERVDLDAVLRLARGLEALG